MLSRLLSTKRFPVSIFLLATSILCFALSILRVQVTHSKMFLFLNWNLFLAFIPWILSSFLMLYPKWQQQKRFVFGLVLVWLLFFPNAPYILTDLFHLKTATAMPMWFDLLLILSFAWVGLLVGFLSLWDMEKILESKMSKKWIPVVSSVLLFVGSYGIYLGRYLRWNSWDILHKPFELIYDVGETLVNPFEHPRAWGVTLLMGTFLNVVYWSLRLIREAKN